MIEGGAGGGVDAHADEAAEQQVAGEAGAAFARNGGLDVDDLGLEALAGEGGLEFLVAVHRHGAGGGAGVAERSGDDGAAGFAGEMDLVGGAADGGRTAAHHRRGERDGQKFTHTQFPPGVRLSRSATARLAKDEGGASRRNGAGR